MFRICTINSNPLAVAFSVSTSISREKMGGGEISSIFHENIRIALLDQTSGPPCPSSWKVNMGEMMRRSSCLNTSLYINCRQLSAVGFVLHPPLPLPYFLGVLRTGGCSSLFWLASAGVVCKNTDGWTPLPPLTLTVDWIVAVGTVECLFVPFEMLWWRKFPFGLPW